MAALDNEEDRALFAGKSLTELAAERRGAYCSRGVIPAASLRRVEDPLVSGEKTVSTPEVQPNETETGGEHDRPPHDEISETLKSDLFAALLGATPSTNQGSPPDCRGKHSPGGSEDFPFDEECSDDDLHPSDKARGIMPRNLSKTSITEKGGFDSCYEGEEPPPPLPEALRTTRCSERGAGGSHVVHVGGGARSSGFWPEAWQEPFSPVVSWDESERTGMGARSVYGGAMDSGPTVSSYGGAAELLPSVGGAPPGMFPPALGGGIHPNISTSGGGPHAAARLAAARANLAARRLAGFPGAMAPHNNPALAASHLAGLRAGLRGPVLGSTGDPVVLQHQRLERAVALGEASKKAQEQKAIKFQNAVREWNASKLEEAQAVGILRGASRRRRRREEFYTGQFGGGGTGGRDYWDQSASGRRGIADNSEFLQFELWRCHLSEGILRDRAGRNE